VSDAKQDGTPRAFSKARQEVSTGNRAAFCKVSAGVTNRGCVISACIIHARFFLLPRGYVLLWSSESIKDQRMSFLPRISSYPAPQFLHGVLSTTVWNCGSWFASCSLGQSVSRLFVCRRHLSLLPSTSNLLIKRNSLFHRDVHQHLWSRTTSSRINEATYTQVLLRSGLPVLLQRWGSSCHSNDLPTIVKIVRFKHVINQCVA
jgi:hypothetical protein